MNAAIAIDAWKMDIFIRHLAQAGYVFEAATTTDGTPFLTVDTDNLLALHEVDQAANAEAAGVGTRQ